jgi:tRNA A-37 threonylcarbamoyl transferase component Bud32
MSDAWKKTFNEPGGFWNLCDKVMNALNLSIGDEIGAGFYGTTYALCNPLDGCEKFVAKIEWYPFYSYGKILNEVQCQLKVSNIGIAPHVYASWVCHKFLYSVSYTIMEQIHGENLVKLYTNQPANDKRFFTNFKRKYYKKLAEAISKMHSVGVYHTDLHSNNIMVTKKGQIKILDYGMAVNEKDKDDMCKDDYDILYQIQNKFVQNPTEKELKAIDQYVKC